MIPNQFFIDDESVFLRLRKIHGNRKEIRGNIEWEDEEKSRVKFVPDPKGKYRVIEKQ
jgi:hypothetical protein